MSPVIFPATDKLPVTSKSPDTVPFPVTVRFPPTPAFNVILVLPIMSPTKLPVSVLVLASTITVESSAITSPLSATAFICPSTHKPVK